MAKEHSLDPSVLGKQGMLGFGEKQMGNKERENTKLTNMLSTEKEIDI